MKYIILSLFVSMFFAQASFAQESISADDFLNGGAYKENTIAVAKDVIVELSDLEQGLALAKSELDDEAILAQKIKLAKKMHAIRPTREQVDSAVKRASLSFPQREQQNFINAMKSMLNYNAIERVSIDAMIETYTLKELGSMVEYYSKAEAQSASDKVGAWASKVQPEVVNMIDKAMMRIRTGQ